MTTADTPAPGVAVALHLLVYHFPLEIMATEGGLLVDRCSANSCTRMSWPWAISCRAALGRGRPQVSTTATDAARGWPLRCLPRVTIEGSNLLPVGFEGIALLIVF
jgi:hypothetical protein